MKKFEYFVLESLAHPLKHYEQTMNEFELSVIRNLTHNLLD